MFDHMGAAIKKHMNKMKMSKKEDLSPEHMDLEDSEQAPELAGLEGEEMGGKMLDGDMKQKIIEALLGQSHHMGRGGMTLTERAVDAAKAKKKV